MGCFFSIFRFGTYVVKETDNNGSPQVNAPEIRKHSSTPVSETTPKYERKLAKPLHSTANSGKHVVPKARDKDKDKTVYTTTFETQVDAPPPHPLEERFQDIQLDEIEVETNLFAPEVEDAVIKIQAGVRGYLVRKQVKELKNNAVNDDEEDTPVVPPPKHFDDFGSDDNQGLSPLCDLEKWKKLSQHLEEIVKDNAEDVNGSTVKTSDDKSPQVPITENVIPLKDSNDHKVIETFDCKENILDIESPEVLSSIKMSTDEKVVEKVFNVLMAETEFEDMETIGENDNIISQDMKTLEQINNKTNRLNSTVSESQESEVLAELNQILDNDEKNMKNNELNAEIEFVVKSDEIQQPNDSKSSAIEIISETTTQEIIRNSFKEFVKEMTQNDTIIPVEPEIDVKPVTTESTIKSEVTESDVKSQVFEPKVEERKTDSKIFEEAVVQSIFDEEVIKSQTQTQIFAIELFKQDISEQQLEKVITISEPEENKQNIEDRVYKTSVDEFVIKPVEPQPPTPQPVPEVEATIAETSQSPPVLETEQKIEITSTESRKNSLDDIIDTNDEQQAEDPPIETTEVIPIPSPIIQIEEQNGRILDEEEAAIRIQAAFRGFQIRRSLSREASPNRSTNNHNNTDNNNNSHNNRDFVNNSHNNSDLVSNDELLSAYNPSEQTLSSHELNTGFMSESNEQINTSLEQLEDQLMQQLISSAEEDDRNVSLIKDNSYATEPELNVEELTAPLLLQRLQQSVVTPIESNEEPIETHPELTEFESQNTANNEFISVDDKPLIEKSDTIIVDLLSSSPQRNNSLIDNIVEANQLHSNNFNDINIQLNERQILETIESQQNLNQESIETNESKEFESIQEKRPDVDVIDIQESDVQTYVVPPTPSEEITPELSFFRTPEQPVLTKIYSSESEQESDSAVINKAIDSSLPSLITVIESTAKNGGEEKPKRPKPILKETDPQILTKLIADEQQITSEEISSPDDDNPEFVGLGPNTPIPVRASSPNPFGKKRRRGKKGGHRK